MTKLGVNIDHSATLRQARYRDVDSTSKIVIEPDIIEVALAAEQGGADSITIHLREDRRHIQDADVFALKKVISTKLNLEMACSEEILDIAIQVKPDYVCLVPENRMEVTTEGGLDVISNSKKIRKFVEKLSSIGTKVSLFIDPDLKQIEAASETLAPMIELHTGAYANAWGNPLNKTEQLKRIATSAKRANELGLTVNSGHGINYVNIRELMETANFNELNIGHTIISRSIITGVKLAVSQMKELIEKYSV